MESIIISGIKLMLLLLLILFEYMNLTERIKIHLLLQS